MADITANINNAQCLSKVMQLTETKVYNLCNGAVASIPNGVSEYLVIGLGAALVLLIIVFVVMVIKDTF
jgi:hypothetical protein